MLVIEKRSSFLQMLDIIHDAHENAKFILLEWNLGFGEYLTQFLDLTTDLLGSLLFSVISFKFATNCGGRVFDGLFGGDVVVFISFWLLDVGGRYLGRCSIV